MPKIPYRPLAALSALLCAAAPITLMAATPATATDAEGADYPLPTFGGWGVNTADIDRSARPGDDFFAYVNGKWAHAEVIPDRYVYSGNVLALRVGSEHAVRAIIEDLAAVPHPDGSIEQRLADSYRAFLDRPAIDAAGMAPAQPFLDRIRAATTRAQLAALMGEPGMPSPIGLDVDIDPNAPTANAAFASISRLGLPDRDYYLGDTVRNIDLRTKYKAMLAFLLGKAGYADAAATAERVYEFEHQIALVSWDRGLSRNPLLTTNVVPVATFESWGSDFPLAPLVEGSALGKVAFLIVSEVPPDAAHAAALDVSAADLARLGGGMPALAKLLGTTDPATIRAWMAAHFLIAHAAVLPSDIDDAAFAFYGKALSGQEQQRPRWQRAVGTVEGQMGEAIGKIYVARNFPPSSKAAMEKLVANLRAAMAANLKDLAWMTPETRAAARTKLDQFGVKIGYPETFKTYDGLVIRPDAPLANAIAAERWRWQDRLRELAAGVDRTRWLMTPQTVNAYYNPTSNEIVFPAAYLQPPFFNPKADDAVNYGAVGATIGHEIGHGFDDQGSRYDGTGRLRNWWTQTDRQTFETLTARLVAQYDRQCPYDEGKTCHNGKLTLGENIGDLGGLSMAYEAYHLSLHGKPAKVIDGLTGDQRFFLAYAQAHRWKLREAFGRQLLKTDPHSLAMARVNAVLPNFDPWYKAFAIKPGDRLYLPPEERVHIW
ncbi:M13 family metallopeptidase [Novosphingobium sp. Fuku2-ISO-50]|uniref:M13 family metallopeptidase n=1 Tax=Novosphingobium sp. Fuku2-ISO-50 TaxID=1739114 RepID=UPI00076C588C|nr:M13 family metallopeptidase [Novosphingobium sp. Fuku2-ISO-50]KUR76528.1 zinc metalloprotease [Novosphingobium sp. Fuku2-ISO-50]